MNTKTDMEAAIADAIMEKPIGFDIGERHFCLYPPTLGKSYLLSGVIKLLSPNLDIIKMNPCLEALRLCREKREEVCLLLAYHTLNRKRDLLDPQKVSVRANLFSDRLDEEELSRLLLASLSWPDAETFIKHIGLDRERKLRMRIAKLKEKDSGTVSFGGLSTYGTLIDFACQRYGWTLDYVVWGISYINLQMLMSDASVSVFLSKEERKKLHIPDDRTFISADDPKNMEKIKSMQWD